MPKKWMDSIFGHVVASKDLKLLLSIGGLYALSVALSNTFVNVFFMEAIRSIYRSCPLQLNVCYFSTTCIFNGWKVIKAH